MVAIPNRSLNAIANPQLAQTTKDNDRNGLSTLLKQISNNSMLIGAFLFTAIWLNIDLIFQILPNGATYAVAKYVVLFLSLAQLTIATLNATISVLNFSRYYYLSLVYSFVLTVSAIWFNNLFIPLYGMNGAAMANLLSYLLYFCLLLITLTALSRIHPFCLGHLKTLAITLLLLILGAFCDYCLPDLNVWVASFIKSALWITALLAAYAWNISPELNKTINEKLHA
jgi:O-antigen/teichoic acid export membrane protein